MKIIMAFVFFAILVTAMVWIWTRAEPGQKPKKK